MHKVTTNERYRLNGAEFEVVATDLKRVQLAGVSSQRQMLFTHLQVDDLIRKGDLVRSQCAPIDISKAPILLNMSQAERATHDRKVAYVVSALNALGNTLPREATHAFIVDHAREHNDPSPPSYSTLYAWTKKYRQGGDSPLALIKNKHHRLARGKQLSDETHEMVHNIIDEHYLVQERPSGQLVFDLLTNQIHKDNEHRPVNDQIALPSRATFYRMLANIDRFKCDLLREGRAYAEKKNSYGRSIQKPKHLFQRIEADTQMMDVIVVDDDGNVRGRPYLTAFMECKSRMIIGWELSMTPPCAAKTMKALKMSLVSTNPIAGKGEVYYIDNGGEFLNDSFFNFFSSYGSKVLPLPPAKPNQKGFIERFFSTLNMGLVHFMKGTTKSNPTARRDYDAERHACLTVEDVRSLFERWLKEYYHQRPHEGIRTAPAMAFAKALEGELPPDTYSLQQLDITCRKTKARAISNGRVKMLHLSWYGPGLPRLDAKARKLGCKPLVHFDESDLSTVWLSIPQEPGIMVQADAVDPDYQNGLTLYEHQLACAAVDKQGEAFNKTKAARALAEIYLSLSELQHGKSQKKGRPHKSTRVSEPKKDIDQLQTDPNTAAHPPSNFIMDQSTEEIDDDLESFTLE
jgi:putative transposase